MNSSNRKWSQKEDNQMFGATKWLLMDSFFSGSSTTKIQFCFFFFFFFLLIFFLLLFFFVLRLLFFLFFFLWISFVANEIKLIKVITTNKILRRFVTSWISMSCAYNSNCNNLTKSRKKKEKIIEMVITLLLIRWVICRTCQKRKKLIRFNSKSSLFSSCKFPAWYRVLTFHCLIFMISFLFSTRSHKF